MDRKRRSAKSCVLSTASVCRRKSPSFPAYCGRRRPRGARSWECRCPFSSIVRRRCAPTARAAGSGRSRGAGPGRCRSSAWGAVIQGQASMSSYQNECTRAPDWRSGGGCRGLNASLAGSRVAAIAGRRCWPRFRRGATEASACGRGYGRKGRRAGLRRSAVDQTIRLTVTLSFRRFSGARDHGWIAARAEMADCR